MEMTSYPSGTPSWADLSTPDIAQACTFYGALFGWTFEDQGPEFGHYTIAKSGGKSVAGISPARESSPQATWATFISVDDIDTTAKAAVNAGATQMGPTMDISNAGRMAMFRDPNGAEFCTWQPQEHIGSEIVNQPGALTWNELYVRKPDVAEKFYNAVFGWQPVKSAMDGMGEYTTFQLDGRGIAGMMEMSADFPADLQPYWLSYFGVADIASAIARVKTSGGRMQTEAIELPIGKFAIAFDTQGAMFAFIQLN